MSFQNYNYERPDIEKVKKDFTSLIENFQNADSFETQNEVMKSIYALRNELESMMVLVSIRHSIDTQDAFYDKENEWFDEQSPIYQSLVVDFYRALVESKFKNELVENWGEHFINIAKMELETFKPEIIPLLQKENKLSSEYTKLKASAQIDFQGERRNLSQMTPFMESKDREMRVKAHQAVNHFYSENEEKFDQIYDELVKVRQEMAKQLGYKNYVELGYKKLGRCDYQANDVKNYREQVKESVVPVAVKLRARQAKRLNLDALKYYDESLTFLTGNPTPKGEAKWMIEKASEMYKALSPETDEFFQYMKQNDLMDLETKKGKAGGGYCTFIAKYKSPFIFSNFNGTSGDVDVLTHEAGHAFQVYSSRHYEIPEYVWPTLEACEIHSMSMEFFAWPWMENFFKEDLQKYYFSHLSDALLFIPYGVTVDAFQHFVYENPHVSPEERKLKWAELEKEFLPYRDYDQDNFLEKGGFWFRQSHIFTSPFYYIDYTLAQVSAFEFWAKSRINREKAWDNYLKLCCAGGSTSYLELLKIASLRNPFEWGSISSIIEPVEAYLNTIDDTLL